MTSLSSIAITTHGQYREAQNRFIGLAKNNAVAGLPVEQLSRRVFAEYLSCLAHDNNNATSLNNNKRAMSALFSKLVQALIIEVNPSAKYCNS
ncbi:phage integrase N-terminal SAM-like domain-containing protein [Nonlabens sp. YIK11]|uniref:phage integrase N-terminal SAM-like domain-containing protein n=1 Tax=Nonlabens sp. YIK11 TaxID=1453349 RepID=UPI000A4E40C9|nr:phage integrase N-terminal SAM-like domain-containing protein [Nonlabens sp. YIK11]